MIYAEDIAKDRKVGKQVPASVIAAASGALIGLTTGALYAYFRGAGYLKSTIVGTVSGAVVFRVAMIKKKAK